MGKPKNKKPAKVKSYKLKTHKATSKRTKRQFAKLLGLASSKQAAKIKRLAPYLGKHRQNPGR